MLVHACRLQNSRSTAVWMFAHAHKTQSLCACVYIQNMTDFKSRLEGGGALSFIREVLTRGEGEQKKWLYYTDFLESSSLWQIRSVAICCCMLGFRPVTIVG